MLSRCRIVVASLCAIELLGGRLLFGAPQVWTGFAASFSKEANADPTPPENQDRITSHVALTRGDMMGLYNAVVESSFDQIERTSPRGTEWANDINNPGKTIAAANFADLSFTTFLLSYNNSVRENIVDRNAVVHLIDDGIYLDVRFTSWGSGQSGGDFSYVRGSAPSGDYNGNGVVDTADYLVRRDSLGRHVVFGSSADGVADGVIDDADYVYWASQFGGHTAEAVWGSVVPEPAAVALYVAAVCGLLGAHCRIL